MMGFSTIRRAYNRGKLAVRRWDAARTNRLNSKQWSDAQDKSVNHILSTDLPTLRARSRDESQRNPYVEGVINTHVVDLIGPEGPRLQVQSSSKAYNAQLEASWNKWWRMPDVNGVMSGTDFLSQWVRCLWTCGEFSCQLVTDPKGAGIKTRLYSIDPSRIMTPMDQAGNPNIVMGVERDRFGKPIRYYISQGSDNLFASPVLTSEPIPAKDFIHDFIASEPGQARGVPWLASSLQTIADLRDGDAQILDAIRQAADFAILLTTQNDDATFASVNESVDFERRVIRTMPPGWDATQVKPEQPNTSYIDYRRERMREVGRSAGMPLMTIMLDSSGHNYSSARFDGQVYQRSNASLQGRISRNDLDRLVIIIGQEAQLTGEIRAKKPTDVRLVWIWPRPPHVDPVKEAKAEEIRLKNGTLTLTQAIAVDGKDIDQHVAELRHEKDVMADAGVPNDDDTGVAEGGSDSSNLASIASAVDEVLDAVTGDN